MRSKFVILNFEKRGAIDTSRLFSRDKSSWDTVWIPVGLTHSNLQNSLTFGLWQESRELEKNLKLQSSLFDYS